MKPHLVLDEDQKLFRFRKVLKDKRQPKKKTKKDHPNTKCGPKTGTNITIRKSQDPRTQKSHSKQNIKTEDKPESSANLVSEISASLKNLQSSNSVFDDNSKTRKSEVENSSKTNSGSNDVSSPDNSAQKKNCLLESSQSNNDSLNVPVLPDLKVDLDDFLENSLTKPDIRPTAFTHLGEFNQASDSGLGLLQHCNPSLTTLSHAETFPVSLPTLQTDLEMITSEIDGLVNEAAEQYCNSITGAQQHQKQQLIPKQQQKTQQKQQLFPQQGTQQKQQLLPQLQQQCRQNQMQFSITAMATARPQQQIEV